MVVWMEKGKNEGGVQVFVGRPEEMLSSLAIPVIITLDTLIILCNSYIILFY